MAKGAEASAEKVVKDIRRKTRRRFSAEEVSEQLIERLGRRSVYLSRYCNDLCAITDALFHLMKVTPTGLTYLGPVRSVYPYLVARLKRSSSRVPHLLSHVIKRV